MHSGRQWRAGAGPLLGLAAAGALLAACGSAGSSEAAAPAPSGGLLVATTVSPITSIASSIAGDVAQVEGIVPEGANSHTYEPDPRVAELLSSADLILVNGLKLEDPTVELARANMKPDAQIVTLGDEVLPESEYIYDFSFPREAGKPNPHLWTDPAYAIKYAGVVRDALAARDPAHADEYAANYAVFEKKAQELADALRADQATVPAGNLKLLTYHDAYAYFAKDFGWEVIGAVQPKSFSDPSPAEVTALIKQVQASGVPTIFGSEVFPSQVLEEIGSAAGVRYEDSLRDDDLPGQPGEPDHSWLGLMKYDYSTMVRGLGGTTTHLDAVDVATPTPDLAMYPQ